MENSGISAFGKPPKGGFDIISTLESGERCPMCGEHAALGNFSRFRAIAMNSDKLHTQRSMVARPNGCRLVVLGTRCGVNSLQIS